MATPLTTSNANPPPRVTNRTPSRSPPRATNRRLSRSPPSLSSLPIDILLKILAHTPKRCYPFVACVSKSFRHLVSSPEMQFLRSTLGKDSLYICFADGPEKLALKWFTLRRIENMPNQNEFVSVDIASRRHDSIIASGREIFFISGSHRPSSSMRIYDARSGKLREGPCMLAKRVFNSVGLVNGRIYVIGGSREDDFVIKAESFDLKNQTWQPAPDNGGFFLCGSPVTVSFGRKVYALRGGLRVATSYDTRDGSCGRFFMPDDKWWKTSVCVVNNVCYVYCASFGLMWYDPKITLWRHVTGLENLSGKIGSVGMADYYGKLALLWEVPSEADVETKEIWCRMIGLKRTGTCFHGTAEEASQLLGIVPRRYRLERCLSLSE